MKTKLEELYKCHFGCVPCSISQLPASGSHRIYYRLEGKAGAAIGVEGTDIHENNAFINLSRHFRSKGLNVPEIFAVSDDGLCYLQQDLGDQSLYDMVRHGRESGIYSEDEIDMLCKAIKQLPKIQFIAAQDLDYGVCYPDKEFNGRMIDFDLNYFKYCFLKVSGIEFNEILLQNDFDTMKDDLLDDFGSTFMYRDFQARNIMWHDGEPWFIDFQGGRRGPVFYDPASFIWQAGSHFSPEIKSRLTNAYLESFRCVASISDKSFHSNLRLFALFRTLQVLGAYGFRGLYEKKAHFISSIPHAMENLRQLLTDTWERYPYLESILQQLVENYHAEEPIYDGLTIEVTSFSFKKGIPEDFSGNGGGFTFDCRALHNPGRYEQYKNLNGRDSSVMEFLENCSEIKSFMDEAQSMTDRHITKFLERGFKHMQINFGCTGGRHRSVYCAEHMAEHIKCSYKGVCVILSHREMGIKEIIR